MFRASLNAAATLAENTRCLEQLLQQVITCFTFTEQGTIILAPCEQFNAPVTLPAAGFRNLNLV